HETTQPMFLGERQAAFLAIGFVELVVVGQFEFGEQLIDGIDVIAPSLGLVGSRAFAPRGARTFGDLRCRRCDDARQYLIEHLCALLFVLHLLAPPAASAFAPCLALIAAMAA